MLSSPFLILFLFVLVSLGFLVVIIDFWSQFYTWQSRIHIGRFPSDAIWSKKVLQKSKQWLHHIPTTKLTDHSRLIVLDMLQGNYKRDAIQSWQEAALILGLTQYYNKTNDPETFKDIHAFLQTKLTVNGHWKKTPTEIDGVILAYAFLNCHWIEHQKYQPAYDAMWVLIHNLIGEDGTVQYRPHMKDYRFVDTIGFICPFLIHYGTKFQKPEAIALALRQITTFNQFGMLQHSFMPCHTYHVETQLPVGLFGWGRGLGWYAIGLIDSWTALAPDHPSKELLTESVTAFATLAMQFQNENGSWSWIVSSKESRMDSSTTATLAWFLVQAAKIPSISERCMLAKANAVRYLMTVTRRDGAIDFSQGDTKGIGVHSQEFTVLPFTQGFCLRTIYYQ